MGHLKMLPTYKAVLNNNQLQWVDDIPAQLNHLTVSVYVTVLDELAIKKQVLPELVERRQAENGGLGIDSESDFSDYLAQLETYEERLARGEIRW
jgi:hypothetical protein